MTGFFPKIACWLFGCSFLSLRKYTENGITTRKVRNTCRRCGSLPPANQAIFIACMQELEKLLEENEELKNELEKE